MALFGRRKNDGPIGAASADAIEPASDADSLRVSGERGIPPVNARSYQSRGQLFAIGVGVLFLLGLMWLINRGEDKPVVAKNDPMATKDQRFDDIKPGDPGVAPPAVPRAAAEASPFEPRKPPASAIEIVPRIDASRAPAATAGTAQRPLTPLEKRMESKTVIYETKTSSNSRGSTGDYAFPVQANPPLPIRGLPGLMSDGSVMPSETAFGALPPSGAAATAGGQGTRDQDGGSLSDLLKPTRLDGASATRIADRTLMLAQGKLIDCVLDTAISTVVAGMTKCSLTRDVYGEDGKVVLLDRGTELTGEYRANLRTGQSRLGIIWTRAKTPTGVVITLASPATDSLGRAGVDGYLDTHFWERYGASILLSSLDDTLAIIANRSRDNGSTIYIPPNTTSTGREASGVALEQNIRIPPTIVKNQGEHVAVFVARDLDFRSVYGYRSLTEARWR